MLSKKPASFIQPAEPLGRSSVPEIEAVALLPRILDARGRCFERSLRDPESAAFRRGSAAERAREPGPPRDGGRGRARDLSVGDAGSWQRRSRGSGLAFASSG